MSATGLPAAVGAADPAAERGGGRLAGWAREFVAAPAVPLLGMLFAAVLVVSRRPDAVTHAQFWGEDGKFYFANVYTHGVLRTLLVPIAGYLQEFPVLAAGAAQPFPLGSAPLVMNVLAIGAQVLPVGLLLSRRAETLSPNLAVRALLAALYIGIPGQSEIDANAVNAQWHLAVSAALVLMLAPPKRRYARAADGAILALSGMTGPFCVLLAPLAVLLRRARGRDVVPAWMPVLLGACAAAQVASILYLSHHLPSGFVATARPAAHVHPTPQLFWRIVGGRVFLAPIIGDRAAIAFGYGVMVVVVGAAGLLAAAYAARKGPPELRLFLALAAGVLTLALLNPMGGRWEGLADMSVTTRYFALPEFAVLASLVWYLGRGRPPVLRLLAAAAVLATFLVGMPREWNYQAYQSTNFAALAARFEQAPAGTRMVLPENPASNAWRMVLVKR